MLWKKDVKIEDWVTQFTVGEDYRWDRLLIPYDITGTRAHAMGLVEIGILTEREYEAIDESLSTLSQHIDQGKVTVQVGDEDCHTVIEQHLTRYLGAIGKKIHTGRSRNDQVLTALRLFIRDQLRTLIEGLISITEELCTLGDRYAASIMPGYTHFQRAMPSTAGLWALGYAELLLSDIKALQDAHEQINTSPLGSAAGYGVPFLPLPRQKVAEELGFKNVQTNVTAVQLSRGKLELHAVHALVQVAATFNRMASDLILYNTSEFGFVDLPDQFCTGSSIMPQKKNPDVLELIRANYHRVLSEMQLLMTLPANLPSGYHRDLQLTKESVMRSLLITGDVVFAMRNLIPGITFLDDAMMDATTPEVFATRVALEKVLAGTPFRDAYREAARETTEGKYIGPDNPLDDYRTEGDPGNTNPDAVRDKLTEIRAWINQISDNL